MEEEEETRGKNKLEIEGKKVPKREILFSFNLSLYINLFNNQYWKKAKNKKANTTFFSHPLHTMQYRSTVSPKILTTSKFSKFESFHSKVPKPILALHTYTNPRSINESLGVPPPIRIPNPPLLQLE